MGVVLRKKLVLFYGPLLFLLSIDQQSTEASQKPSIIAAYYESWPQPYSATGYRPPFNVKSIDPKLITDLYVAFANFGYIAKSAEGKSDGLTGDYSIQPFSNDDPTVLYPELRRLKILSGGKLKLFLSVGGSQFNDPDDPYGVGRLTYRLFSKMVSSESSRKEFIQSAINYAHLHGFDGVDIDWEFPGVIARGGDVNDFINFIKFLKECSDSFHSTSPKLLLSFCAPPVPPPGIIEKYSHQPALYYQWLLECSRYTDRITLMAYNFHTPFDDAKITGVNAPLKRDTSPLSPFYIENALKNYTNIGIDSQKILLGIPLYGWQFQGVSQLTNQDALPGKPFEKTKNLSSGLLPYFKIADLIYKKKFKFGVDLITSTAYAYNLNNKIWISFDTPETVALKVMMAKNYHLGGVIFWAINYDEYKWEPRFPNIRKAIETIE